MIDCVSFEFQPTFVSLVLDLSLHDALMCIHVEWFDQFIHVFGWILAFLLSDYANSSSISMVDMIGVELNPEKKGGKDWQWNFEFFYMLINLQR